MMTAGSGLFHSETIGKKTKMRLLQFWLNFGRKTGQPLPRVQDISLASVPKLSENGVIIIYIVARWLV